MSAEQIEERLRSMQFAQRMPPVKTIQTDPTGRIRVGRMLDRVGSIGPIELITADGRYIGTINDATRPSAVNTDGALGAWIERDELDVEHIGRAGMRCRRTLDRIPRAIIALRGRSSNAG